MITHNVYMQSHRFYLKLLYILMLNLLHVQCQINLELINITLNISWTKLFHRTQLSCTVYVYIATYSIKDMWD